MQRLPSKSLNAFIAFTMLAACSGGGGSPGGRNRGGNTSPIAPPIVTESFTFPSGNATATSGTAWDITGIKTTLSGVNNTSNDSYNTLRVDVTFAQELSNALPAPGQMLTSPTQLGVEIFFDIDADSQTGTDAACSTLRPFEFYSDAGDGPMRLSDGNYAIRGSGGAPTTEGGSNPAAEAIADVSGHDFSETFFLPTIRVFDGTSTPKIGVAVEAFNGADLVATDCVPNSDGALEVFTTNS